MNRVDWKKTADDALNEIERLKSDRSNCTLVPTDKLKDIQAENERLRAALIASQTWLYGHENAEGQAERRRLNADLCGPREAD